jgi:hypothetical protein
VVHRLSVVLLALAGCYSFGKTTSTMTGTGAGVSVDGSEPRGASVEAVGGAGGWYAAFGLSGRRIARAGDPEAHHAVGLDLALRVSPLGLLANDHALERYLDFGAETGVGFKVAKAPPHILAVEGEAWVGGWVELGLFAANDGYVALTGNLRTVDATSPWLDRPTELTFGIAWRHRGKPTRSKAFFLTPD